MPPPFLSTLSARARRAYPIIVRGVREGLNSIQIGSVLAAGEGNIRRTSLLGIMRRVRNIETVGVQLRFLKRTAFPDPRRLPEALTKLRRAFSFTVRLRGIAIDTGQAIERFVTVSLDNPRSRDAMERIAEGFASEKRDPYGFDLEEVLLMTGVKAGAPGTLL